jgi:hypothetical protein
MKLENRRYYTKEEAERGGGARSTGGPMTDIYVSGNNKQKQIQIISTGHIEK